MKGSRIAGASARRAGLAATVLGWLLSAALAVPAWAAPPVAVDTGNAAWVLSASGLVLFMTLPGLAAFYGGLVRARNVLSVLMHCFTICCAVSVLWVAVGYSLAFHGDGAWIGNLDTAFLARMAGAIRPDGLPEIVFVLFQMTFAIITPALIVGAFPERVRFPFVLLFSAGWLLVVYVPVAHWVWGGGWLARLGTMDFAGGIVVHTTAGVSALVAAILVGRRQGFPHHLIPPHNPGLTMLGASMLWFGWFGFNGGSALAANETAGAAIVATHLAAAAAGLTWMTLEWLKIGKPTSVGIVTGAVAGLATITPGSGYVGPMGGIAIGVAGSVVCFFAVLHVKGRMRVDDSLDVFAVHGVGGMLGSLLVSLFALHAWGGVGLAEGMTGLGQLGAQAAGVGATALWSALATFVLIKLLRVVTGIRVSEEHEFDGLDLSAHGERAYDFT